jgi:hypothetical protein
MKRWHRGYNSCSRSDLEFVPLPNSALVRRREERAAARAAHVSSHKSAAAPVSVVKDGRKMDSKPSREYEEKVFISISLSCSVAVYSLTNISPVHGGY